MTKRHEMLMEIAEFAPTRYLRTKHLKPILNKLEGSILEIGCGRGVDTKYIKSKQVLGLDIDEAACQLYTKNTGFNAKIGDAEKLPFRDATFDNVTAFGVLEHMGLKEERLVHNHSTHRKGFMDGIR